jgi:hypothetical protein
MPSGYSNYGEELGTQTVCLAPRQG